jgi:trans-aconitate methyltransferase
MKMAGPMGRPLSYREVLSMADALGLKSFDWPLHAISRDTYIECHSKRYAYLLNTIGKLIEQRADAGPVTALDIGPGFQTRLMQAAFPDLEVDTLGFADAARMGFLQGAVRRHHEFDLNNFQFDDRDVGLDRYDIIVFCEVIEHLYTMPEKILARLRPHVKPGGVVVVQTPNAVQWRHRVRMLMGRNPFERISHYRMGHYREYTAAELYEIAAAAGFDICSLELRNYFGLRKRRDTTLIEHLLWPIAELRSGITAVIAPKK